MINKVLKFSYFHYQQITKYNLQPKQCWTCFTFFIKLYNGMIYHELKLNNNNLKFSQNKSWMIYQVRYFSSDASFRRFQMSCEWLALFSTQIDVVSSLWENDFGIDEFALVTSQLKKYLNLKKNGFQKLYKKKTGEKNIFSS